MAEKALQTSVFKWEGTDKKGAKVKGELTGQNPALVKAQLRKQGVNPTKVTKKGKSLLAGTGKKIKVCNEVAGAIGLKNLVAEHLRGEDEKGKYDFVVSRAVMQLPDLMKIIKKNFKKAGQNALPNGLLCLKGGNLKEELKQYYKISEITPLSTFFDEEWFSQDKQLVYVPA